MPIKRLLMLMILVTVVVSLGLQAFLSTRMIDRFYTGTAESAYTDRVENLEMLAGEVLAGRPISQDLLARDLVSPIVGIEILDASGTPLVHVEDRMQMMHGRMMQREAIGVEEISLEGGWLRLYLQGTVADSEAVRLFGSMLLRSTAMAILVSLVLALTVAHLISKRLTRDLSHTAHYAEHIASAQEVAISQASGTREIADLQRALNRLSFRLKAQARTQKEKADVIAHEVRTPLTILQSTIEAMRDGVLDTTPDRYDRVLGEIERLRGLVEDLPSIVELHDSEGLVHREPTDLASLVLRLVDGMRPSFEKKEISLAFEAEKTLWLETDANRVIRILHNLLANALKYSDPGGQVRVSLEKDGDKAHVHVDDRGVGIPESEIPRLFEAYFRGKGLSDRPGEGLGLYTAKAEAEAIGGRLTVKSESGKGSRFTLTLPVA